MKLPEDTGSLRNWSGRLNMFQIRKTDEDIGM